MLWSCKLLWMCGSSYKIQGEGASKKMKFYPQKLKKNKVANCFCCSSNWNDSCRFKKCHCLKIKWGKMGDGVEGLECRPIRAGPAHKWRKKPKWSFSSWFNKPRHRRATYLIGWNSQTWLLFTHGHFLTLPEHAKTESELGALGQKNPGCHLGSWKLPV